MNAKTTVSRHIAAYLFWAVATVGGAVLGSTARADNVTLPEQLIGVTQGFLEFT
ncbi:MAG: flagellar biosynthesis protein FlgA, partial [Proteobacteria bacterium]